MLIRRDGKAFKPYGQPSAEPHRGLPHEGQKQKEEGDDGKDVHQRAEGLIGLWQLSQGGGMRGEAGQQEVRHGVSRLWQWAQRGPLRSVEATTCGPPVSQAPRERNPLKNNPPGSPRPWQWRNAAGW